MGLLKEKWPAESSILFSDANAEGGSLPKVGEIQSEESSLAVYGSHELFCMV